METRRTERDRAEGNEHREVMAPTASREWPTRPGDRVDDRTMTGPPVGPRVRWGGVMSGLVTAIGTILFMTALGLAIGMTAVGDPRAMTDNTASGMGIGASVWAGITLLIACFLGGMVSTRVTDRPDRGGALIHGTLVWTLASVLLLWLLGQGLSFGLSNLFGALGGLTRTAATTATATVTGDSGLAQSLGFTEPTRIIERLDNPETASLFATATGMSTEEARQALTQFRSQVEAVRENPDRVAAEVRNFLNRYADRAQQQAMETAAAVQEGAATASWVTFGILALALLVSILGALAGVPSLHAWRLRWANTGTA